MNSAAGIERRTAMKMAVGAATAGVVWSAPRVEGLSLRPSYAAAASNVTVQFNAGASPGSSTAINALNALDCVLSANIAHLDGSWMLAITGDGLSNCTVSVLAVTPGTGLPTASNNIVTSDLITVLGTAQSITSVGLVGEFSCS